MSSKLKLGKFIVQVVLIEEDEDGNVIGEQLTEAMPVYGVESLKAFADGTVARVAALNTED